MATGWVQSIEVIPSRKVSGEVVIICPYARDASFEGTVDAAAQHLVDTFPRMFLSLGFAKQIIQRGRELRGIIKGVGYIEQFDTQAI